VNKAIGNIEFDVSQIHHSFAEIVTMPISKGEIIFLNILME
jgi:hypothetical protein